LDLTIIFATYKNEQILEKSLLEYCHIQTSYSWELIIIDNACRQETRDIITKFQSKLPLVFLDKSEPGKNNALNKALPLAKGELLFFTDNDIIVSSDIVNIYVNAAKNNPGFDILGGKIRPDINLPSWVDLSLSRIRSSYGLLDLGEEDFVIKPEHLWGGNLAIRKEVFEKGLSFNSHIGPSGKSYIMGSETELLLRLEDNGYKAKYIAKSIVFHQIREEQLSVIWLAKRAYRAGKGGATYDSDSAKQLCGVPRYLFKVLGANVLSFIISIFTFNKRKICNSITSLFHVTGRIRQSLL
jgi:glycosyltransferase involved in cell wall biosynthesis